MALTDLVITPEEIKEHGISSADNPMVGNVQQNKDRFDQLVREVVAVKFNALLDELEINGAGQIGALSPEGQTTVQLMLDAGVVSEDIKYIRLNQDGALETSMNGEVWATAGSGGHIIIAPDGRVMPKRTKLRFANGDVRDDGTQTIVTPSGKSAYNSAQDGGYEGTEQQFNADLATVSSKANKSVTYEHWLMADGWEENTYTIWEAGVTATSNQEILPAVDITAEQLAALQGANLQDGGQEVGSIKLKAYGAAPDIDIPIRVIVRGDA